MILLRRIQYPPQIQQHAKLQRPHCFQALQYGSFNHSVGKKKYCNHYFSNNYSYEVTLNVVQKSGHLTDRPFNCQCEASNFGMSQI